MVNLTYNNARWIQMPWTGVWRPDLTVLLLEGVAEKMVCFYSESSITRQQLTIYISLCNCVSKVPQLSTAMTEACKKWYRVKSDPCGGMSQNGRAALLVSAIALTVPTTRRKCSGWPADHSAVERARTVGI
jgi:hypothetical protein